MTTDMEGQSKLEQLQGNVEEVRIIMQDNYTNVKEREEKLKRLDERAEALLESSKRFHKTSKRVRNKMEKENTGLQCKIWKIVVVALALVALVIIIICIAVGVLQ
ncbi:vesicle-associated membrane protein 3-like [Silurus meridionalis]|uniref:V-SNARE coiled-coil homology domain-containing protein n=1 Tax=Silurus meridionalis TaxID=175797 RepID=A0A8T0A8X0_SILME|nr:vesicle-associated membrane protein 3-like [Silurus meridionalis]KAF7687667.1 hypothetical protein HF521_014895 [Silurus meridionalis]